MTEQPTRYEDSIFGKDNALVEEFLGLPGYLGSKHLSPLYFQGIPTGALQDALDTANLAGQRRVQGDRFWSTPPRYQGGGLANGAPHDSHNANPPVRDVMEVNLASAKPINHVTFDLAHFPQVALVQFAVGQNGAWQPVRYEDGAPVRLVIADSNPPVIAQQGVARQNNSHPQHYGAGHWRNYDLKVKCLDVAGNEVAPSALRVVLTRPYGGEPPVDPLGNDLAYSLGVRGLTVGYKVESRRDVPDRPLRFDSITEHTPFAQTRDILGSTLSYALRETPAGNLKLGGIWRSEPQPVNYAVVNLYVDLTQGSTTGPVEPAPEPVPVTDGAILLSTDALILGGPVLPDTGYATEYFLQSDWLVFDTVTLTPIEQQVIDRIYLDPLVSGCTVNIYYTNDTPNPTQPDPWAYVRWTPINRDFKLRRGMYRFDPIEARHLKFEFTHLAPEPYEAYLPQVRTVKVFPHSLPEDSTRARSGNTGGDGTKTAQELVTEFRFNDSIIINQITDTSRGYTPTEVFWSDDPAAAKRLRDLSSSAYNYQAWQGGLLAPQFTEISTHSYTEIEAVHDQKVAYYAGLKNLEVFRADYTATEDTDQYLDYFYDDANISNDGGWIISDQDMHTPDTGGVEYVCTSRIFLSKSNIMGVQFATTQTPAIDLLGGSDSDFNSAIDKTGDAATTAIAQRWEPVGDCATWLDADGNQVVNPTPSTLYNTDIGTTVKITRYNTPETQPKNTKPHTWDTIGIRYGTYGNMERLGLTYGDMDAGAGLGEAGGRFGGIRNKQVLLPAQGSRIYAAARVIAPIALENPLTLRLVNHTGETVAESSMMIPANQIVEWFADYTAGENTTPGPTRTWGQVQTLAENYGGLEQYAWDDIETTRILVPDVLYVELIQKGEPNASWFADTISVFEDPIRWEFSNNGGKTFWPAYGIRNNPNGVLTFPSPPMVKELNTWHSIEGVYQGVDYDVYGKGEPTYAQLEDGRTKTWEEMEGRSFRDAPVNNALVWRAKCNKPGIHVNGLSIRPWYDQYDGGVPSSEGVNVSGPNIAMYDHYQPIAYDPRYRIWNKPVPQSWYFFYRQFLLLRHDEATPLTEISGAGIYLPETVVGGTS